VRQQKNRLLAFPPHERNQVPPEGSLTSVYRRTTLVFPTNSKFWRFVNLNSRSGQQNSQSLKLPFPQQPVVAPASPLSPPPASPIKPTAATRPVIRTNQSETKQADRQDAATDRRPEQPKEILQERKSQNDSNLLVHRQTTCYRKSGSDST